jgi:hypothetical protein
VGSLIVGALLVLLGYTSMRPIFVGRISESDLCGWSIPDYFDGVPEAVRGQPLEPPLAGHSCSLPMADGTVVQVLYPNFVPLYMVLAGIALVGVALVMWVVWLRTPRVVN